MDKIAKDISANNEDIIRVTIGNMVLKYQENCQYETPEPPVPIDPIEVECVKATFDAKMIAKAVVEMNKKDPKDIDFVYD